MGRGRARGAAILGLIGATALLGAGCGESRHANEQRPQVSTRVSVTIVPGQLIVQPTKLGTGADKTQQIPQNEPDQQPPIRTRAPLDVTFVAANQTDKDTRLQIRGTKDATSETVYAHSPGTFGVNLPTGSYVISAPGLPEAKAARFTVGRYRASSQNDVLLP
jgi:hypothetical protein